MEDKFRERLREIRDGRRVRPRVTARSAAARLTDLGAPARSDGVLVFERSVGELTSQSSLESIMTGFQKASEASGMRDDVSDEIRELIRDPARALFVDTETTGLGANMVFMLGAMFFVDGDIRLRQVFARDYREEPALLEEWSSMLRRSGMIVSFNGKAFDLPVLRDRLAMHGAAPESEPAHLDLLHHARRRWKHSLPDCRLQTLEWKICGRRRSGDIPGEEIPGVYHHFVRTGEDGDIVTVFHHNALDLITLADLALALAVPDEGGP